MLSITYISSAAQLLSESELIALLRHIRPINERLGITGMLLYRDGNIIQTIEGPNEAVQQAFDKIQKDGRHKDVFVLLKEEINQRQFPNWSMGFHNVAGISEDALNGYSSFLKDPVAAAAFKENPEPALQLLTMFRENMH